MSAPDFAPGHVLEAKTGGYLVKSRTTDGAWWLVYGDTCSCPADVRVCFHQRQVAAFCAALSERYKRPRADDTSEAVVSRFVD